MYEKILSLVLGGKTFCLVPKPVATPVLSRKKALPWHAQSASEVVPVPMEAFNKNQTEVCQLLQLPGTSPGPGPGRGPDPDPGPGFALTSP